MKKLLLSCIVMLSASFIGAYTLADITLKHIEDVIRREHRLADTPAKIQAQVADMAELLRAIVAQSPHLEGPIAEAYIKGRPLSARLFKDYLRAKESVIEARLADCGGYGFPEESDVIARAAQQKPVVKKEERVSIDYDHDMPAVYTSSQTPDIVYKGHEQHSILPDQEAMPGEGLFMRKGVDSYGSIAHEQVPVEPESLQRSTEEQWMAHAAKQEHALEHAHQELQKLEQENKNNITARKEIFQQEDVRQARIDAARKVNHMQEKQQEHEGALRLEKSKHDRFYATVSDEHAPRYTESVESVVDESGHAEPTSAAHYQDSTAYLNEPASEGIVRFAPTRESEAITPVESIMAPLSERNSEWSDAVREQAYVPAELGYVRPDTAHAVGIEARLEQAWLEKMQAINERNAERNAHHAAFEAFSWAKDLREIKKPWFNTMLKPRNIYKALVVISAAATAYKASKRLYNWYAQLPKQKSKKEQTSRFAGVRFAPF